MSSSAEPSAKNSDFGVQIYAKDVATLEPRQWLGDQVIAFLLETFSERASASGATPPSLLLLEPSVSFTAAMVGEASVLREMLSVPAGGSSVPLVQQLAVAQLVVMPVNNNEDASVAEGGGHWSLLVFRRAGDEKRSGPRFEHYDSAAGANGPNAQAVMRAIAPLLLGSADFSSLPKPIPQFVRMVTPQQANGHDCGVYMLAIAELLCCGTEAEPVASGEALGQPVSEALTERVRALTPEVISAKRKAWCTILGSLLG